MNFTYTPKGVCSLQINFDLEDGVIRNLNFSGGCDGNLKGICALADGRKAKDVAEMLAGIRCEDKYTSCPDQLARAVRLAMEADADNTMNETAGACC